MNRGRRDLSAHPVRGILTLAVCAVLLVASCGGAADHDVAEPGARPRQFGTLAVETLHSVLGKQYQFRQRRGVITVESAKTNPSVVGPDGPDQFGGVIIAAFWPEGQQERSDQQACVRLHSIFDFSSRRNLERIPTDRNLTQRAVTHAPGIALRVHRTNGAELTRAIAVTQHTLRGHFSDIVVTGLRIEDLGMSRISTSWALGTADFSEVVGRVDGFGTAEVTTTMKPPPWNLCASAVGTTISIKLWVGTGPAPSWSDKKATRTVEIPRDWVFDGFAGALEAGLAPGGSSEFSHLEVSSPY